MSASIAGFYLNPHRSQYDPGSPTRTRRQGCVPTALTNGANASTGGAVNKSAAYVHELIPQSQETDPNTPGWSLVDGDRAAAKLGVGFDNRAGQGWTALVQALDAGLYVDVQGDSDQFPNGTCSGDFDGNHCIGIHPATRLVGGLRQRWIDDGICPNGRWEYEWILFRYARKLNASILFGVLTRPVPRVAASPLQALINRARFLRLHEPAAARRYRRAHPIPAHETTDQRTTRLRAEVTALTKARIARLVTEVRSLRRRRPVAAKAWRKAHPIPSTETLRQRDDRLTAEVIALRKANR